MATGAPYQKRWATRIMSEKKQGKNFLNYYPYPVQVWLLGDQSMVILGGEVVIDYAIQLKRILGQDTFVMGYANDVMSYIPSARVLQEGGYEGAQAQMVYGLHGTWEPDIETKIVGEVYKLARQAGLPIPERALSDN